MGCSCVDCPVSLACCLNSKDAKAKTFQIMLAWRYKTSEEYAALTSCHRKEAKPSTLMVVSERLPGMGLL